MSACCVIFGKHQGGISAWNDRFGEEFDGRAISPGALVWFRPSTVKVRMGKMYGRLQPGVFLGYELGQGCVWRGVYYVADLESFRGIHLNQATPAKRFTHCVHATKIVRVPDSGAWTFPLKNQYDFDNGYIDIAGLNAALYSGPQRQIA